jgi:cytosine/adenosine deaminase-related metal-dependent hydrolase
MLEVLRGAEKNFPSLTRGEIFAMATAGGARALKLSDQVGSLARGKKADIIGIRREKNQDPLHSLFQGEQVEFSMVGGRLLIG